MRQFDRQYRFAAGPPGGTGFEIGETSLESPTALHINFTIDKCDTETPNTSKISLWNLNKEHLAILNEKDCLVTLKAGYDNHIALIFVGTVTHITTELDGADRETSIELADGRVELRDTYVSLSYSGAINQKKIIEDIATEMGVAVTFSYNVEFYTFNGFSVIGPCSAALDKACASNDLTWQIQNGVLQIKRNRDTMTREVYILSPETGLINIPKRINYGKDGTGADDQPGWEVQYLMNGAIAIGDFVRFESKHVQGYFRVRSIEMNGDNLSGDCLVPFILVSIVSPSTVVSFTRCLLYIRPPFLPGLAAGLGLFTRYAM